MYNYQAQLKTKQNKFLLIGLAATLGLLVGLSLSFTFISKNFVIYMTGGVLAAFSGLTMLAVISSFPNMGNSLPNFQVGQKIKEKSYQEFPEASPVLEVVKVGSEVYLLKNEQGQLKELHFYQQQDYQVV